ncbi:kinesin-like protein KIF2C isoform X2 [Periophthalmus magnuspinnatus]|uniref:kinesin-like protein KIF2C isoform X2 n=1 Tax=Periophthalmus magnuspinnatus TaxID=409849 RepID=UPI00243713AD|nr:kinesin-like protein KIF2C isoform X2 [Periophthalmus magnuspinnatus]
MDTRLYKYLVGRSVNISRSDGRIHLATVKTTDTTKCTVMVEWQEKGNCRGKEVEVSELCTLNPELLEIKVENKAPNALSVAQEKKYEGRLRSSRIPAPAFSALKSQARQTCFFQATAPSTTLAPTTGSSAKSEVSPASGVINSGSCNQRRKKNETKPMTSLAEAPDAAKENDEPPPPAKGRRKSVAPQELNKANKRMSCVVKPPEMQLKRGKFGESTRPNQKFYDMIQEFRESLEIIPMSTSEVIESHRICVCVRKRPLNKQECNKKEIDVVSVPGKGALLVHEPKQKVDLTKYLDNQVFQFDYSFDETANNDLVYKFTAKPLVKSIFEGGMATCFAYGQTGSGKTHTMGGDFSGKQQNSAKGIYAFASQDVFAYLNHWKYTNQDLSVYVSFFEIYNGKVYDLLNKKAKLRVLEDERQQVQVVGLEEVYVTSADEVIKLIQTGSACRTSGQTSANANSSRSHAILQIVLRRNDRHSTLHGKFSLVDLAGNERGTDVSSNDRSTLVETAEINRSLLALKECIRSLGKNSDHIPFRMSTLTKVLRDSFIGEKSRTCMIAMVSPSMASCEYTMNTLRYADRVKELNGNSKRNGVAKAEESSDSSSEESAVDASVYDAISQVRELEEKIYAELQKASDLAVAMEQTSYNIETGLPDIIDYSQKLMDTALALKSAVDQERMARLNH